MESATRRADTLKKLIASTEAKLENFKSQLAAIEALSRKVQIEESELESRWPMSPEEYQRYGRQMIVPFIGIQGQMRLRTASVLVVGAGGLGCPAAAYLAGAGVGTLGIVDGDVVEISNLHRQILHNTSTLGMKKVDSAISYLKVLNPNINYVSHAEHLSPQNAEEIVAKYDLILDCTDHPTSRYLISDISVLLQKPLISASALRIDGQLLLLNSPPLAVGNEAGGPCYRCVFPKPPPADTVVSCGDGGIVGPVVGIMGVLQALEAVRLVASGKLSSSTEALVGRQHASMLLFSSFSGPSFRNVRLKGRRKDCFACSGEAGLSLESLRNGSLDYMLFCGAIAPVTILAPEERVEAWEYAQEKEQGNDHILVDVRDKVHFDICSLPGSVNVPLSSLQGIRLTTSAGEKPIWLPKSLPPKAPIYVICRLGNDSQVATKKLKENGIGGTIKDIRGGFKAWRDQVDPSWPEY